MVKSEWHVNVREVYRWVSTVEAKTSDEAREIVLERIKNQEYKPDTGKYHKFGLDSEVLLPTELWDVKRKVVDPGLITDYYASTTTTIKV